MHAPNDWWRTFFTGVAVDLWLHAIPAAHTQKEADVISHALGLPPGAEILDAPCGHGRLAVAMAERGYHVTGVDLSDDALGHARRTRASVSWEARDMRDLPWPSRFDGAFCVGNSFGYMGDDENAAFIAAVASALKPGGRFVLEYPVVAESWLPGFKNQLWAKVGDMYLLVSNQYDHVRGRFDTEYTFVADGRVDVRHGSQRVYTYRQIVDQLESAGFGDVSGDTWARTAGPEGAGRWTEPYYLGAPVLFLKATKRS